MTYDEVLTHFQVKKRYQDKAQCKCPAHDDRRLPLLSQRGVIPSLYTVMQIAV